MENPMFTRNILKNITRSLVTNASFCLLLILAGALFTLSAGLWYSVYRSEKNLDDVMTTIAIPDMHAIRRYVRTTANSDDLSLFTDDTGKPLEEYREIFPVREHFQAFAMPYIHRHVMSQISENIYQSNLVQMDDRRVYGAYAAGLDSVRFVWEDETATRDIYITNSPQSVAAFVAECLGVEEVFSWSWEDQRRTLKRSIVADFRIEEYLYLHHGRVESRTATGYFPYMDPDGSFPVEEGKRYVIVGYDHYQGGNLAVDNPPWYNDLPVNRSMPMAIYVDVLGSEHRQTEAYAAWSLADISENIRGSMGRQGVTQRSYPIKVYDKIPLPDPVTGYAGQMWFEIDGSIEDALNPENGEHISAALSVAGISYNSLTVITTNDLNSLLRFNQRLYKVTSGRAISRKDMETGARVCVISELLAETNSLDVGDKREMQMFITTLGQLLTETGRTAWVQNPYHPNLELTAPVEYEIIGIYGSIRHDQDDHGISPNTVIIPATSFDGIDGAPVVRIDSQYSSPLLDAIIVPNEMIKEAKVAISSVADGYGEFFRFYDQGYSTFKPVLSNLRIGMTGIAALAAAGWAIAVLMFSLFYIRRKKSEAALLYALGVGRNMRFRWVFSQSAIIILLAQVVVLAATMMLFDSILDNVISVAVAFTESYRDFSLSEMVVAGGFQISLPLDKTMLGLIVSAVGMTVLMLVTAGLITQRTVEQSAVWQGGRN